MESWVETNNLALCAYSFSKNSWQSKVGFTKYLSPPLFSEVPAHVPSQKSERSCTCEFNVSILSPFLRFFYHIFGTVPTVFCGFHFIHLSSNAQTLIIRNSY